MIIRALKPYSIYCLMNIILFKNIRTDFHSLDSNIRKSKEDQKHRKEKPVIIHDNVFIGAYSIILKGVEIGENSIIGTSSVVTKQVPANQIWAGNPARFIKYL